MNKQFEFSYAIHVGAERITYEIIEHFEYLLSAQLQFQNTPCLPVGRESPVSPFIDQKCNSVSISVELIRNEDFFEATYMQLNCQLLFFKGHLFRHCELN